MLAAKYKTFKYLLLDRKLRVNIIRYNIRLRLRLHQLLGGLLMSLMLFKLVVVLNYLAILKLVIIIFIKLVLIILDILLLLIT